jgi:cytidine deaminase
LELSNAKAANLPIPQGFTGNARKTGARRFGPHSAGLQGMSVNPFVADPAIPARLAAQDAPSIRKAVLAGLAPGWIVPAAVVSHIVARHDLAGPEDVMRHLVDTARSIARPPISGFFVGAVGLADTGDLILGGNLEFPGTHLATTVHGEGFVATRAFQLGLRLTAIALGEAHPCAHCRQYLSEFAGGPDLRLIDLLGHDLRLGALYPWPFDPAYLGQVGAVAGAVTFPALSSDGPDLLNETGRMAWSAYSGCPGAVVIELQDGTRFAGASVESVAFKPTMPPLQAALIAALAHGHHPAAIRAAWLGTTVGGAVDYSRSTAELLAAVAPAASLSIHGWAP